MLTQSRKAPWFPASAPGPNSRCSVSLGRERDEGSVSLCIFLPTPSSTKMGGGAGVPCMQLALRAAGVGRTPVLLSSCIGCVSVGAGMSLEWTGPAAVRGEGELKSRWTSGLLLCWWEPAECGRVCGCSSCPSAEALPVILPQNSSQSPACLLRPAAEGASPDFPF